MCLSSPPGTDIQDTTIKLGLENSIRGCLRGGLDLKGPSEKIRQICHRDPCHVSLWGVPCHTSLREAPFRNNHRQPVDGIRTCRMTLPAPCPWQGSEAPRSLGVPLGPGPPRRALNPREDLLKLLVHRLLGMTMDTRYPKNLVGFCSIRTWG